MGPQSLRWEYAMRMANVETVGFLGAIFGRLRGRGGGWREGAGASLTLRVLWVTGLFWQLDRRRRG